MKGRPCGFMCAWLAAAAVAEDREKHWAEVAGLERDFGFRDSQRQWMLTQGGGPELLAFERNSAEGLGEEPAGP